MAESKRHFEWTNLGFTVWLSVVTLWLGYIQSPLYLGARPHLDYWVKQANGNTKDANGFYSTDTTIVICNSTSYPAGEVFVKLEALGDGSNWLAKSKYHFEEMPRPNQREKVIRFPTIPANSEVVLQCSQRVPQFDVIPETKRLNWERRSIFLAGDYNDSGDDLEYFAEVLKVYDQFGDATKWPHKCETKELIAPEDWRSEQSQAKNEERRKAKRADDQKSGKEFNPFSE